jgi:hypothetical protein
MRRGCALWRIGGLLFLGGPHLAVKNARKAPLMVVSKSDIVRGWNVDSCPVVCGMNILCDVAH